MSVRVTPRSSQEKIVLVEGGIHVWVHAAPAESAANEAVCSLIAKKLNLPVSVVTISRGHHSRDKVIVVAGLEKEEVLNRLREQID